MSTFRISKALTDLASTSSGAGIASSIELTSALVGPQLDALNKMAAGSIGPQLDALNKMAAGSIGPQLDALNKMAAGSIGPQLDALNKMAAGSIGSQLDALNKMAAGSIGSQLDALNKMAAGSIGSQLDALNKMAAGSIGSQLDALNKMAAGSIGSQLYPLGGLIDLDQLVKSFSALVRADRADNAAVPLDRERVRQLWGQYIYVQVWLIFLLVLLIVTVNGDKASNVLLTAYMGTTGVCGKSAASRARKIALDNFDRIFPPENKMPAVTNILI